MRNPAMSSLDNSAQSSSPSGAKLYRALWRWHFYAGLFVVPFLIMLSLTGLMILWFSAIAPEFGERMIIRKNGEPMRIAMLQEAIVKANPGSAIIQYIAPYSAENPALFLISSKAGERVLTVNPYTGGILQNKLKKGTWNEFITDIHGTLLLGGDGALGDILIETAASLGVLLIATGLYLWWPRGDITCVQALIPQFSASGRAFWKSLHSATGAWISIILLFFFISGLAWTSVWGGKYVQAWSTFPAEKWDNIPLSNIDHASMNHSAEKEVPWTLEQALMPASGSAEGITSPPQGAPEGITSLPQGRPVVLESIVALGRAIGFKGRFQVTIPKDEKGVWTLSQDSQSYDSTDPFVDRTVHIDQYTGKILATAAFADYPLAGKAMAVGIALHEGQTGWWNIVANALFCLSVVLMCASGIVMWWIRRPANQSGAPLYARQTRIPGFVLVVGITIAAAFPLGGLAMLTFAVIDFFLPKSWKQAS
jgi:uncharacterized iron-regulated membrane protein